jgi:hypothetical protein
MFMKYVKAQVEQDQTVVELCSKMSETYTTADKFKILDRVEELPDIIQKMIEQTVECSLFIKEYIGHKFSRKFKFFLLQIAFLMLLNSDRLLDVWSKKDVKAKIAKFNKCFDNLKKKFDGEVGFQVAVELFKTSDAIKGLGKQTSECCNMYHIVDNCF